MTVHTVMVIGHGADIDMNFTLYAFLALVGTVRYVNERQESEAVVLRWAVFAGLMAGAAWTVKYTALQLVLLLVLVAVAAADRFKPIWTVAIGFLVALNVFVGRDTVLAGRPHLFWSGRETRDEFLTRRLIPYQVYAEANRRLGPGDRVYLVNMRTWGYLLDLLGRGEMQPFPNGWRSDYTFEHYRLERALMDATGPGEVAAYFRDQGSRI